MNKYAATWVRKTVVKLDSGQVRFRLYNLFLEEYILGFEHYINNLVRLGEPYQTVSAKAQDLSRFYDYYISASQLIEDVHKGSSLLSPLAQVFSSFPIFLAFGEESNDELAKKVAISLGSKGLKSASVRRILSSVRAYTLESARIENSLQSFSQNEFFNVDSSQIFASELLSRQVMPEHEKKRLLSQSFLAGCISGGAKLTSTKLFKLPKIIGKVSDSNYIKKSFPVEHAVLFCQGLTSARDKCLYALLFGAGLRMHEALQIKIVDINFANETVKLSNPDAIEFMRNYTNMKQKGVTHYEAFLIEPFKSFFFDAAEAYWANERPESSSEYFFLTTPRFGSKPMFTMHKQSLVDGFRGNLKRLGLNQLLHLAPHSTRHFYGFYMLNFCPVVSSSGEISHGYPIEKVRYLMRHDRVESTEKYAVQDVDKYKESIRITNSILEGSLASAVKQIGTKQSN